VLALPGLWAICIYLILNFIINLIKKEGRKGREMSSELKQLFHSPEDLSDSELEILRVKLQNMRRLPKIAAGFGLVSAALI